MKITFFRPSSTVLSPHFALYKRFGKKDVGDKLLPPARSSVGVNVRRSRRNYHVVDGRAGGMQMQSQPASSEMMNEPIT